jgi:hypothetical protein
MRGAQNRPAEEVVMARLAWLVIGLMAGAIVGPVYRTVVPGQRMALFARDGYARDHGGRSR